MHDPSDYDSVYSEEDFLDTVRGAETPPLMDYEEFRVKTMGESFWFLFWPWPNYFSLILCLLWALKSETFFDMRLKIKSRCGQNFCIQKSVIK